MFRTTQQPGKAFRLDIKFKARSLGYSLDLQEQWILPNTAQQKNIVFFCSCPLGDILHKKCLSISLLTDWLVLISVAVVMKMARHDNWLLKYFQLS